MKRKRHKTNNLDTPVTKRPVESDELIGLFQNVAVTLYPQQTRADRQARNLRVRYNALVAVIRKCQDFLVHNKISSVVIDEKFLQQFKDYLVAVGTADVQTRIYCSAICKLVNNLPASIRQRELCPLAQAKRENRLKGFTDATQEALNHFRNNGMKLRKGATHNCPALSNDLLADNLRRQIVDSTLTFMRAIDADDILSITEEDVEEYVEWHNQNGKKSTAQKTLDFIRPLFSNMRCRGLLQTDPLRFVPRQTSGSDMDFVDQAAIDKLADLTTLDMDNFIDVRGRVLAFALDYAYALRNKESSLVRCSDFHGAELRLPREIQKIQRDTLPIYSYFPDITTPLLKRYMELRTMKNPSTDILIISLDGKPLGGDGCRRAVQQHCRNLGITTHEGNTVVNPHRLRHSFGTLNIDPLGLCLPVHEIKEQLRHSTIQMTYDTYITKNPLHKRSSYEKRMARINGVVSVPKLPLPPEPVCEPAPPSDTMIGENEALRKLRQLGLSYKSLRAYAQEHETGRQDGNRFLYSLEFVTDLASNYFTRKEAMDFLNMPRATFFDWTKREAIDFILIRKVSLFCRDVIMEKRRAA